MNMTTSEYFDTKWRGVIKNLPTGGQYRFDLRKHGYDIMIDEVGKNKKVFDFACGLGIIDIELAKKGCEVSGCDYSQVASDVQGKYDSILSIYYIEHIKDPVGYIDDMLKHCKKVITAIPNNFSAHGEHVHMAWNNWDSFYELFKKFKVKRIDEGKYPDTLIHAFKHPIITFQKGKK